MLHHFSFNARNPKRAADALAALLAARAFRAPSPPFPSEAWFVCLGDEHGTLIEVMPWGDTRDAAGPNGVGHDPDMRRTSGSHVLVGTEISSAQVIETAQHYGWRAEMASAGLFKFVKVWVENAFLIELLPPEHRAAYCAAFGSAGIDELDHKLREIETALKETT